MTEELKKEFSKLRFLDENGETYPEWEEKKLGKVSKITMGQSPTGDNYTEDPSFMPLIQGNADLKDGKTAPRMFSKTGTKKVFVGDYVMSVRAPVGNIVLSHHEGFIGRGVCAIKGNSYIYQILKNMYNLNKWDKISQGTTFGAVSGDDIKELHITLPSLPEQEKIANFLSKIDEKIEAQAKFVELLKKQKQGYSQKIFNGSLRFKKDDGTDYDDWEEKKLGDLVEKNILSMGRGKVISKNDILNFPGEYPIYSSSALNNGKMGEYGKYMFDDERISWSVDGGGKFFYREPRKYSITNVSGWMKVIETSLLNTKFLYYNLDFLWQSETFDYSHKAHPSVINKIYTLFIPSLPEQEKIAEFLTNLDNRIDEELNKLEQLKLGKNGYMQRVLG